MDPVSIVGLTASLITVVDTLTKVSKGLVVLQKQYRDAPSKLFRLQRDVESLGILVTAIRSLLSDDMSGSYPPALISLSRTLAGELQRDLVDLEAIVDKVNRKSKRTLGQGLIRRTHFILAEDVIAGFQSRVSTHMNYLSLVQTMLRG